MAQDDAETGILIAIRSQSPFERAQFLAIRDSFLDGWQPAKGIESAMIDMLAQTYSLYLYWTRISHDRATQTQLRVEQTTRKSSYSRGSWETPYQSEANAVDQAYKLADGYNRQFLHTLRQLRDLRRYAPPVIVNNGGQVNVTNQQVNVNKTE
jgi:hypothetical protein